MHKTTLTLNLSCGIFTKTWDTTSNGSPFAYQEDGPPFHTMISVPQKGTVFEGLWIGAWDSELHLTVRITECKLRREEARLYSEDVELYRKETRVLPASETILRNALLESGWKQITG